MRSVRNKKRQLKSNWTRSGPNLIGEKEEAGEKARSGPFEEPTGDSKFLQGTDRLNLFSGRFSKLTKAPSFLRGGSFRLLAPAEDCSADHSVGLALLLGSTPQPSLGNGDSVRRPSAFFDSVLRLFELQMEAQKFCGPGAIRPIQKAIRELLDSVRTGQRGNAAPPRLDGPAKHMLVDYLKPEPL